MPDLTFQVEGARAVTDTAAPLIALALRVANAPADEPVAAVSLGCQVRIEPAGRAYAASEQGALRELFGEPERFARTTRASLLWTTANVGVPAFTGATTLEVLLPCTYDLRVATAKYFHALEDDGAPVPLRLLFSGTIFYREGASGALQVARVPWSREAAYLLAPRVWQTAMQAHYPDSVPLPLRRDVLDRLYRYRAARGLGSFEHAIEQLLAAAGEAEASR